MVWHETKDCICNNAILLSSFVRNYYFVSTQIFCQLASFLKSFPFIRYAKRKCVRNDIVISERIIFCMSAKIPKRNCFIFFVCFSSGKMFQRIKIRINKGKFYAKSNKLDFHLIVFMDTAINQANVFSNMKDFRALNICSDYIIMLKKK